MRKNLFTLKEVTAILKASETTVLNLINTHKLEHYKVGNKIRVSELHITNYLKSEFRQQDQIKIYDILNKIKIKLIYLFNSFMKWYKNHLLHYTQRNRVKTNFTLLNDLAVLKEVDMIEGTKHDSNQLKRLYSEKIITIQNTDFIPRILLCKRAKQKSTQLNNCIHLGEFSDYINKHKTIFQGKKRGSDLFEFTIVANIPFVKLNQELKNLLDILESNKVST